MSRIRSIKPEFWTDEKIVMLPYEARLLFIGMWNFADDDGFIDDEPHRIRLQVLPADNVDCGALIDLLVAVGLLERYFAEEESFLRIKGFSTHQKVSHKTPTKFPVVSGKKQNIPASARRHVAQRYGCLPGKEKEADCYFCGSKGRIWWASLSNGRPSSWVAFSGLELDHLEPEKLGGATEAENLVLSCRTCNRGRGHKSAISYVIAKSPEHSGRSLPEWKGIDHGSSPSQGIGSREPVGETTPRTYTREDCDPADVIPLAGRRSS